MISLDQYLNNCEAHPLHPAEIATLLKDLDEEQFQEYLQKLPKEIIGDVALELPDRYFGEVVENFSADDLSVAVKELESDDQTDFIQELEELDTSKALAVFNKLDKADQAEILHLKQYNEDEAGAYMQMEVFTATEDENVRDVIRRFAALREKNELENTQNLFITHHNGVLLHSIKLEDLLVFDFKKTFKEIIKAHPHNFEPKTARDTANIEEVVHCFEDLDLSVIPVVNGNGVLLGRITSDDIYDIINEKATEQMFNLAGVNDDAEEEGIFKAGKKRALWLSINLITAIAASIVIGLFQETLQSLVALAVLMPIVASMGGNAGTQSLTVIVRQLALGDITRKNARKTIIKEIIISICNGLFFALLIGIIASIWFNQWMLGVVIALAMVINLLAAGFFGATIPLLLKKLNIDPAIGSTVILTTVTDIIGFLSFLGLASLILI